MAARKSTMDTMKETVVITAANIAQRVKASMREAKPKSVEKAPPVAKAKPVKKSVAKARKARKAKRR